MILSDDDIGAALALLAGATQGAWTDATADAATSGTSDRAMILGANVGWAATSTLQTAAPAIP